MGPVTRNRLMDELEVAKKDVADCEQDIASAESDLEQTWWIYNRAVDKVEKLTQQFPECRYWAAKGA